MNKTKLHNVRMEKGYTLVELANITEIAFHTINSYDSGKRSIDNASISKVVKICENLGCKISDILEDEENVRYFRKRKLWLMRGIV